jgi:hypothetical protein
VVIRRQLKRRYVLAFFETAILPGWHRGLRLISPLVARTSGTRPYRAINAASLREALRQTAEERHGRR